VLKLPAGGAAHGVTPQVFDRLVGDGQAPLQGDLQVLGEALHTLGEDGRGDNYLRGLTPDGAIYDFARNAHEDSAEFCGACFSPDGGTLFVNVQVPGFTYAITGPWESLRSA